MAQTGPNYTKKFRSGIGSVAVNLYKWILKCQNIGIILKNTNLKLYVYYIL